MRINYKSVIITIVIFVFGTNVNAQGELIGKTYQALVRQSCSRTIEGGYTTLTYQVLKFETDSVYVSEYSVMNSFDKRQRGKEQKYSWEINNGHVIINDFTNYYYDSLVLDDNTLKGIINRNKKEFVFEDITQN